MTIEFKVSPYDDKYSNYQILIENELVYGSLDLKSKSFDVLSGSDKDISTENTLKVFELPLEQLPSQFVFEGTSPKRIDCMEAGIYISTDKSSINRSYTIVYSLDITIGNLDQFQSHIAGVSIDNGFYSDIEIDHDSLTIELRSTTDGKGFNSILNCLETDILKIKEIDDFITAEFVNKSTDDFFVNKFNFPPQYKFVCSQYLIWFGELLTSLNINADVWTEPDNGGTNLIISHKKDPELLEKIKEVFYQYIQLPYAEFIPVSNEQTAKQLYLVTSLENQVSTFKSQIQLKDAAIALLNTVVSSKDTDIIKLNEEKQVLIDSLENGKSKVEQYSFLRGKVKLDQVQYLNKNKSLSIDLSLFFGDKKDW